MDALNMDIIDKVTFKLNTIDWSGISGISDILMVILSVILLLGIRQGAQSIKESSYSRDADILRWAMEEMDKLKPHIRTITNAHKREKFCNCPSDKHSKNYTSTWNEEELSSAQIVSVNLQRIGYMSLHNLVSRNHFMNIWGPMFLSSWYALEGWVKHKRLDLDEPQELADGAYSRMYLEQYALYCEENLPIELVNNERKRFHLPLLKHKKRSILQRLFKKEKLNI